MRAMKSLLALPVLALAAVKDDEVSELPGFPGPYPFKLYSGFLNVTFSPTINGYDGARIHYQFHTSQRESHATDPVVAWHTGGPGGSSIYGQYAELGYFQVSTSEGETVNDYSWNNVANMLFLEAPAGSFLTPVDEHSGFSYCTKNGTRQEKCSWDDVTQAQAYVHTLQSFFAAYPELSDNDFFLAGESYAGQYIPNIANELLSSTPEGVPPLQGIAVGNGCWGGNASSVVCNGPNEDANDVEFYHGKGLVSTKLYKEIQSTCEFPSVSDDCEKLLKKMDKAVGPHNVYNVYDNCPNLDSDGKMSISDWLVHTGKSQRWLRKYLSANLVNTGVYDELDRIGLAGAQKQGLDLENPASGGGYDWTCGQFDALPKYFAREDVRKALHLPTTSETSTFEYTSSGPASITLYPELVKQVRVLIYNGDADTCVPYIGNEEWTTSLAEAGVLTETSEWHPWYQSNSTSSPTGYATTYGHNFQFATVRLAGHQVPKNMPEASLALISALLEHRSL
mgnify:CR=1 FL=1